MFQYTSNSFLFAAAAAVALIVWLDSRTGSPGGKSWSFAGRPDGASKPGTPSPNLQQRQAPDPASAQWTENQARGQQTANEPVEP